MTETDLLALAVPLVRQGVLFVHLIVFAFAFVLVIQADLAMIRGGYSAGQRDLHRDARVTAWLLLALWGSGLVLVGLGSGFGMQALAGNPKVAAKLTVVTVLTLNGLLLHVFAFPRMAGMVPLSRAGITLCVVLGAVSSVSWVASAAIGTARIVAPLLRYHDYLVLYGLGLGIGLMVALTVVRPLLVRQWGQRVLRGHRDAVCPQGG